MVELTYIGIMKILDKNDPRYLVESTAGETFELRCDGSTMVRYKNGQEVERTPLDYQQPLEYLLSKLEKGPRSVPVSGLDKRFFEQGIEQGIPCLGWIDPEPWPSVDEQINEQYGFLKGDVKPGEELRWHRASIELYLLFDKTNDRRYLEASDHAYVELGVAKPRRSK